VDKASALETSGNAGNVERVSMGDEFMEVRWQGKASGSTNPMSGCGMRQDREAR
jgi:hypothetical protein